MEGTSSSGSLETRSGQVNFPMRTWAGTRSRPSIRAGGSVSTLGLHQLRLRIPIANRNANPLLSLLVNFRQVKSLFLPVTVQENSSGLTLTVDRASHRVLITLGIAAVLASSWATRVLTGFIKISEAEPAGILR
jgi:hypothetical protein